MLITVLFLSGSILGATTIAGLLTLYQLRQSANASDSAKALFAADSGLEWELYKHYRDESYPEPVMENGAVFRTTVSGNVVKSTGFADAKEIVARAFQLTF